MTKLLWLSDSAMLTTGFSDQTKCILNGLTQRYGWDCWEMAHAYQGQTLFPPITFEDKRQLHFKVLGMGREPYGKDIMAQRIKELRPDVFGILLDTFMLYGNDGWFLRVDTSPAKTFFYFPSDGGGRLPLRCEAILKKVDLPIAMSKFAQKQAWDLYKIKTDYIPHAIDMNYFYPLSKEEKIKLRAKWGYKENDFIVMNVFRNQGRKFADRMIIAFAKWCKLHPNAKLLMHCDPYDAAAVFNIISLINRYGIENRCRFTGMRYFKGFDYKQMNEVYNIADVKLDTTSGEGFGITTIEAMACKIPIIITDYTTSTELIEENGKCGELIKLDTEITGSWNVDRGVCDIDDAILKLEKLYQNESLRKLYGENGRKKVEKFYSWDVVLPMWKNAITKLKEGY
jgi:glycosyltransferase involved in cell wall biosynthesis